MTGDARTALRLLVYERSRGEREFPFEPAAENRLRIVLE